eukprot:CAMPEP_0170263752 /NCGR_PEP_ID=MMETSP0116_2-20130129/31765_1 /TAXON_ID=400756 /ORGANISM="Durinskia baltica, Strain CSIRO CS-38" /LENGTH=199 /DNA_ID=CAMNT_0010514833 /DNA_START=89 /DNA_END=684 /DNA_ORIENTATION=+
MPRLVAAAFHASALLAEAVSRETHSGGHIATGGAGLMRSEGHRGGHGQRGGQRRPPPAEEGDDRAADAEVASRGAAASVDIAPEERRRTSPHRQHGGSLGAASLLEASTAAGAESEADAQFIGALGKTMASQATDLAYKVTDVLFGTAGIQNYKDFPFACICNVGGVCEGDPMKTPCKARPGSMSAAPRVAPRSVLGLG